MILWIAAGTITGRRSTSWANAVADRRRCATSSTGICLIQRTAKRAISTVLILVHVNQGAFTSGRRSFEVPIAGTVRNRKRWLVIIIGNVLCTRGGIQQPFESFRWTILMATFVIVIIDEVATLSKSFDTSLVIFQIVRFGGRSHDSFTAATTVAIEVMDIRYVLLLLLLPMVMLGSDWYSNIGLGSPDGTEPRAVQTDSTARSYVITAETRRLTNGAAESGSVVVVVVRRSRRQGRGRINVTVRVQPITSASARPESISTSRMVGTVTTGNTTGGRRVVSC